MKELLKKLEAILFIAGEPLSLERLSKILKKDKTALGEALSGLAGTLSERGLRLSEKDGEYLLVTAPELGKFVEDFMKEELGEELSRAALETLAVIVYKGPLSRSEIDYIRGVNSSFTVRNLMIRGLIERKVHPRDSRVWLYRPSFDFLKFMGLEKLDQLPGYNEFKKEMEELLKREPESAQT
ncbi:MAG: SMC-Scp complex subunit ScpB [Patescibacteria group bacterium]